MIKKLSEFTTQLPNSAHPFLRLLEDDNFKEEKTVFITS